MRAFTRFVSLTVGVVALISAASAATTIGHGQLKGLASVRAGYDSNIFVNDSEVGDTVGTFEGAARYTRDSSIVTLEAAAGLAAYAFARNDDQNAVDPFVSGKLGYVPTEKTDLHGSLDYRRNSLANEALNDRSESNDLVLHGYFQHLTTEKIGFRLAADYAKYNYLTRDYSDVENYSVGVHGVHLYSPKLKLLAGVTALEWWTDNRAPGRRSPATRDWRYSVGAEGELSPKVTGDVSIGYLERNFRSAGFREGDALYVASSLSWQAAEKTRWKLMAKRDLSVSAADQSVRSFDLTLSVTQTFSEKLTLEGSAGLDYADYEGFNGEGNRKDEGFLVRGRLNYMLNNNLSADLSAGYRDNDSTLAISDYSRFNLGAGLTLRF